MSGNRFYMSLEYVNLYWLNVATGIPTFQQNLSSVLVHQLVRDFLLCHCNNLAVTRFSGKWGCNSIHSQTFLWNSMIHYLCLTQLVGSFANFCRYDSICAMVKTWYIGFCHSSQNGNSYDGVRIWILIIIEDHTLLWKICPSFNHGACDDTYRVSSKGKMRQAGKGHFQASSLWFYNYLSGTLKIHHNCGFWN